MVQQFQELDQRSLVRNFNSNSLHPASPVRAIMRNNHIPKNFPGTIRELNDLQGAAIDELLLF